MLQYNSAGIRKRRKTTCKFCWTKVTNFERHLERNHTDYREVTDLLSYPKNHKERKRIIALIRNCGNFTEYLKGNINPKYNSQKKNKEYYPCSRCKALLAKQYLARHRKTCIVKDINDADDKLSPTSASQTLIACSIDQNSTLQELRVKEQVFPRMRADGISMIAKSDYLIYSYGDNYLKKHNNEQLTNVCSNKMRELARYLIEFRKITNSPQARLQDTLKPRLFDVAIECAKKMGGYNVDKKSYKAPSLSVHIGTTLKQICELFTRLIMKEDTTLVTTNREETLKDTKRFKELLESRWTTEISSLAFNDLNEKLWEKPVVLPLTRDIKKFKEYVTTVADKSVAALTIDPTNKNAFKDLVHAALTLTILFNRKGIGDVQYTKLETYTERIDSINQEECEKALSESEKVLTKHYKRIIVTGGKGSKPVAILFPLSLQAYVDFFLKIRLDSSVVPQGNPYLFGCPGIKKWTRGDVVIRKFAQNADLEYPGQISSNKLRKQIATVMQILNLNKEETEEFTHFMGHTEKTHNEYSRLPQDVYQTAKISRLLLLMEKGTESFKGKSLYEIDINPEEELAEDDEDNDDEPVLSNIQCQRLNIQHIAGQAVEEIKKKNTRGRTPWTSQQGQLVKRNFKKHIDLKRAPKKNECVDLINKYPDIFFNKNWVQVKTFVYNAYRLK